MSASAVPSELRARAVLELCAGFIERAEAKAQAGDGDDDLRTRFLMCLDELRRVADRRPLRQAPAGAEHRHATVDRFIELSRSQMADVEQRAREIEWRHAAVDLELARVAETIARDLAAHRHGLLVKQLRRTDHSSSAGESS
jgi:hypothetical protein